MPFNERESLVIQTMAMRLNEENSLKWINSHIKKGDHVGRSLYWKIRGRVKASSEKRKFAAMNEGLLTQHFERIDQLETILSLSWENFHRINTKNPLGAQRILDSIANIQPLLSQYYEDTQYVIESEAPKDVQQEPPQEVRAKDEPR